MVPNGWSKTYLKNIISGTIKNGYSPLPAANTTGYWVMGLGALTDNGINPTEIKPVELDAKVKQALLTNGDFLISRSNTPDKVGRSIRFKGEIENCSYPDLMMKFRVDPEKADPNFVEFKLSSQEIRQYFKSCAAGSSSTMVKINKSAVENTPLLLPSFLEQKKIAQIISTWDKAITTTEQMLTNSQQQKKALMQQLLTGKKRLLDENGVRFGGEWTSYLLDELEALEWVVLGRGNVISKKDIEKIPGDYPIYSSSVKNSGLMGKYGEYMFDEELISWSVDGGGNFFYRPKHKFSVTNVSGYMRLNTEKLNYQFIAAQLELHHSRLEFDYQSKAHPSVIRKTYTLTIPSLDEQQKIAAVLSTADQEISALQQKLDVLKQEKKALMQQLLTGKRRVTVEEA
ncbi:MULTISPECIES: restriction endonuclease subunit S [Vibrio]|uniref:restriction endonuclease subunit S n=1 Tax=Vibrio TaxID=662 RepID=UPI001965C5D2|nr:restriction endonuclease subunit S [Vibrio cholerae]